MRTFMVVVFVGTMVLAAWANYPTDAAAQKVGPASDYGLTMPPGHVTDMNVDY